VRLQPRTPRARRFLALAALLTAVLAGGVATVYAGGTSGPTALRSDAQPAVLSPAPAAATPAPLATVTPTAAAATAPVATPTPARETDLLAAGSFGPVVLGVQQRLTALGYRPGPVDGHYGAQLASAVMAFQKHEGLARDGQVGPGVRSRLAAPTGAGPVSGQPVPRIEVDLARQIAFVVTGAGTTILNVSSGSDAIYTDPRSHQQVQASTPTGVYRVQRRLDYPEVAPLGTLYRPLYFYGGWAVHGAEAVPAYPASHGCVRVSDADQDWLFPQVSVGTTVVLYDAKHPVGVQGFTGQTGSGPPPQGEGTAPGADGPTATVAPSVAPPVTASPVAGA
jgi:peptidoglycan hydrolase-like protein with peptidoglycan-binding domain